MADIGKTTRVSRTNVGSPSFGGPLPSERSRLVGHEVRQSSGRTGLEGLAESFASFFGQVQGGLASVQEGVFRGEQQRIQQENAAQKNQALGDALSGKEMDPGLAGDLDYYDAFRTVKAQRDGYSAYQDFHGWYINDWLPQNPTGDLMAAREDWAKKNLTGSDDADYDGQVLAAFFQHSDSLIPAQQEFALKFQIAKGIENQGAAIDADVAGGLMDAKKLAYHVELARKLDPLNASEAPARVASALLASAENHPDQMMAVANVLEQPGTGVNGKSFAQSWPEAYADFQSKAVSAWNSINSVKDMETLVSLEDRLRDATTQKELVDIFADTVEFRQKRGAFDQTASILDSIMKQAEQIEKQEVSFRGIDQLMGGNTDGVDPSDVKKNWAAWLENRFGVTNILDMDPRQAVRAVQQLGGIAPEEVTLQLSSALTSVSNPAGQAKAIELISTLAGTSGKDIAGLYLNEPAQRLYENVHAQLMLTSDPMEVILKRVNEARAGIKSWDAPWKTVLGTANDQEATTAVEAEIDRVFQQTLGKTALFPWDGRTPKVPLDLREKALEVARQRAIEAVANGRSWQDGVKDAVNSVAVAAEVLPGPNGLTVLPQSFHEDATGGRGMTVYYDDAGKEAYRPRLGYNVPNLTTGRMVNTIEVYENQLTEIERKHSWMLRDGSPKDIGLRAPFDPAMKAAGVFEVYDGDEPVVFAAGEEVTIGVNSGAQYDAVGNIKGYSAAETQSGVTIQLPSDRKSMDFVFADLPEGFTFMPMETNYGMAWRLVYRPNFGEFTGKTADQQEASFAPPPAPLDQPVDGEVGIREMMLGVPNDPLWSK